MAKVILITSREISTFLSKVGNEVSNVEKVDNLEKLFVSDSIDAPFFRWCYAGNKNLLKGSTLEGIERYNSDNERINIRDSYKISEIFTPNNSSFKIPNNIQEDILTEVKKKIGEKYTSSCEYLGQIKYFYRNNAHFFVAHEFPDKFNMSDKDIVRRAYMEALVSDILAKDGISIDDEWFFISHDKDWTSAGNNDEEIKSDETLKNQCMPNEDSVLKTVFDKDNTRIFVFQHSNSEVYSQVIENFGEDTITVLTAPDFKNNDLLSKICVTNKETFE